MPIITDDITILNYPGSKRRLLDFIENTFNKYISSNDVVLDIFAGTNTIGYRAKDKYKFISNDAELYSYIIGKALVENTKKFKFTDIQEKFNSYYENNLSTLNAIFPEIHVESKLISERDITNLTKFYSNFLNIWQDNFKHRKYKDAYHLFTIYYSNSYFGLLQAMEIDSIRYAIEQFKDSSDYYYLLTALYYAMKECVFSKDGHMAQPLNLIKNSKILLKRREKSILQFFLNKLRDFECKSFKLSKNDNKVYNYTLDEILSTNNLIKFADLIYADPPYTDLQYSRYYHLLDTVTRYDYPDLSMAHGKISTGIYRKERFQSPLSQRGKAKSEIEKLIKTCASLNKKLVFSYAYPVDISSQKSDRYTMSIDDLKNIFYEHYGKNNTSVICEKFNHCNNRNKNTKLVYEYLIIGIPNL